MASVEMVMPKMGESIMEGTILKWLKKEGDRVEQDEAVLEVATDKVDTEVPATQSGILKQILAQEGDVVEVGKPIAIISTSADGEDSTPQRAKAPATPEEEVVQYASAIEKEVDSARNGNGVTRLPEPAVGRFYSPLVLTIAREENIPMHELEYIPGSGTDNRVTKKDILNYIASRKESVSVGTANQTRRETAAPVPPQPKSYITEEPSYNSANHSESRYREESAQMRTAPKEYPRETPPQPVEREQRQQTPEPEYQREVPAQPQVTAQPTQPQPAAKPAISYSGQADIIEMDRMRKMIAQRMVESKRISPHVTSFVEADVTNIVYWRNRVKHEFKSREGDTITYTPVFIEAIAKAIKDYPMINASVDGDRIIVKKDINIGMAVALPSGNLIVPVIKGVDQLNIIGITKRVNDLARRARENKLTPDDLSDGTFTMSNVGSFGNVMGTPIIVQPQIAIMAFGAIQKKPAVIESPFGDTIGIRHFMFLSHSYDHRVVDGSLGGMFVRRVADYLEAFDVNRKVF